jgi:hypothetical protein
LERMCTRRKSMFAWALLAATVAWGQEDEGDDIDIGNKPPPAPAPDWGFEAPKSKKIGDVDDDPTMADFAELERKKAPPPVRWYAELAGKKPLTDSFDIWVSAFDDQLVLVELPVLVATSRESFLAEHPGGLVLQADVTSAGVKRTIIEHVLAESVYASAPTIVFLKAAIPNPAAAGDVRFLVKTQELPPPPPPPDPAVRAPVKPPPPPPPAPLKERFARTTVYLRK